jgi:hypothetical protein
MGIFSSFKNTDPNLIPSLNHANAGTIPVPLNASVFPYLSRKICSCILWDSTGSIPLNTFDFPPVIPDSDPVSSLPSSHSICHLIEQNPESLLLNMFTSPLVLFNNSTPQPFSLIPSSLFTPSKTAQFKIPTLNVLRAASIIYQIHFYLFPPGAVFLLTD